MPGISSQRVMGNETPSPMMNHFLCLSQSCISGEEGEEHVQVHPPIRACQDADPSEWIVAEIGMKRPERLRKPFTLSPRHSDAQIRQ